MKIAVYCSAKNQIAEDYLRLGDELGHWIGECGHTLVYGGATGGLMTRVSRAVHQAGGQVIGVIPTSIIRAGRLDSDCDQIIEVENMAMRKFTIRQQVDMFIALPGSYGTMDEMMDVIASGTVGEHHKPLFVVNHQHFYDALQQQVEHMLKEHFIGEQQSYKPVFVNQLSEIYSLIKTQ